MLFFFFRPRTSWKHRITHSKAKYPNSMTRSNNLSLCWTRIVAPDTWLVTMETTATNYMSRMIRNQSSTYHVANKGTSLNPWKEKLAAQNWIYFYSSGSKKIWFSLQYLYVYMIWRLLEHSFRTLSVHHQDLLNQPMLQCLLWQLKGMTCWMTQFFEKSFLIKNDLLTLPWRQRYHGSRTLLWRCFAVQCF